MQAKDAQNSQQLLELAVLDAFALLEPMEAELFDRAFHDAPQAVQDRIRLMQADLAADMSLLPSGTPPADLRQRVLDAVAAAADKEASRLAPLALIGARSAASGERGRATLGTTAWRAAAMALLGVSVVLAIFAVDANRRATRITEYALNVDADQVLQSYAGIDTSAFFGNPDCRIIRLERLDGEHAGYIRIAINERNGDGHVMAIDLPDGEELILRGTTPDGKVLELARLTADGPVVARGFHLDDVSIAGTLVITAVDPSGTLRWG